MRKFLLLCLVIISIEGFAQPTNYIWYKSRERKYSMMIDSMLFVPRYNGTPSGVRVNENSAIDGAIAVDTANGRQYFYYNNSWRRLANYSELGVDSIWREAGKDSIFWSKAGNTYKIKDSAGASGLGMKVRRSLEITSDSAQLLNDSASFASGAVKVYGYDTTRGWKNAAKIVLSSPQDIDGLRYKSSNGTWVNYSLIQKRMQFQIGLTDDAPASGDSTLNNLGFFGKHLRVYRDGLMQTQDDTIEGFELSDSLLTVHPPWSEGERVIIETSDTTVWQNLALYASGGGGWVDITPLSAQTGLTESPTNVWAAAGSAFNDYGLSSLSLPSSTDGAFIFQIVATTGEADMIIGFNASNSNQNYTNYEAGVYMAYNGGSNPIIYKVDSGTPTSTGIGLAPGTYVGIFRVGSTFTIRSNTVKDTDFSTWTTRATLTYSSSAAMYMNINPNNTHSYKIYYPQCIGCL